MIKKIGSDYSLPLVVLENAKPYVVFIRSHGNYFFSPKLEIVFAFGVVCVFAAYANLVLEEGDELLKGLVVHGFVVSFPYWCDHSISKI